ncbi:hypothetical protein E0H60_07095 [Rhizobium leguminosarum bv. viciae]|nr:hypothetical protein E0H60_07095 [Rhizobium leguminosarum bv. viciae]TBZ43214.1 hypothetical protein E0H44_20140 [Rhizobium leguminosarum bv. viciae]TCA21017.1 hypothetical protein E0H67_20745 [Rhizobium leguminosarum bv. viciae]
MNDLYATCPNIYAHLAPSSIASVVAAGLFLFPAKTPMNRRDDETSAGNDDANYRPGLPRALSGRKVRVFGAWIERFRHQLFHARCALSGPPETIARHDRHSRKHRLFEDPLFARD